MSNHIQILFIEDVLTDVDLAVRELEKGGLSFDYIRVETKNEFKLALNDFRPDIVISDYIMPSYSGLQALKDTREFHKFIPFILFTESVNEDIAVQCMKAGANDYVLKEHPARLPYAVEEAIEKKQLKLQVKKQCRL
jgi:DNA-binding NtrC family response regulator